MPERNAVDRIAEENGIAPSVVGEALAQAILRAAKDSLGEDLDFEATYDPARGVVDLFHVMEIVEDTPTRPRSELAVGDPAAPGFEVGDQLLRAVFYRDEDAPVGLADADWYRDAIGRRFELPESAPAWLRELWPKRRLTWRWGLPVRVPTLAEALDALDAWLGRVAPAARARLSGCPSEALAVFRDLGPVASELVAFYERFGPRDGDDDGAVFFRGECLQPPASVMTHRRWMDQLESPDPRWTKEQWYSHGWLPVIGNGESTTRCLDVRGAFGGDPGQVGVWAKDDDERTIEAPSLGSWLGLLALGVEAEVLGWDDEQGIHSRSPEQHTAFYELHRAALPGFPKPNRCGDG